MERVSCLLVTFYICLGDCWGLQRGQVNLGLSSADGANRVFHEEWTPPQPQAFLGVMSSFLKLLPGLRFQMQSTFSHSWLISWAHLCSGLTIAALKVKVLIARSRPTLSGHRP